MLKPGDQALCNDPALDPEWWHPTALTWNQRKDKQAAEANLLQAVEALEVCDKCPIKAQCLEFAFNDYDAQWYGIWGGTLAHEREAAFSDKESSRPDMFYDLFRAIRKKATERGIPVPVIPRREPGQWQTKRSPFSLYPHW